MSVRRIFKRLVLGVMAIAIVSTAVLAWYLYPKYAEYQALADSFDLEELQDIPAISEVFDTNGQRYSRLSGEVRYVVPFDKISPLFVKALQAREDSRFFEHRGVDPQGIVRAAWKNVRSGGVREGASTLTQQLARNTFALGDDRWKKKFVEALLAWRIEGKLTKEEIIEAYANRIYYGAGLYGVETASRACFGKSASDLTLSEAAVLAGLIRSPNRLSPLEDGRKAIAVRNEVLARMVDLNYISPQEADDARKEELPAAKRMPPIFQEDFAMDTVMRDLHILIPKETIDRGGLKIYTTIDRRLQLLAQDAVDARLEKLEKQPGWKHPILSPDAPPPPPDAKESPYVQSALIAIDNETGGIRAVIGGRDFKESPLNRAVMSKRQVGSTFKPFIYAAAFDHGLLPGTLVSDEPLSPEEVQAVGNWAPENSDRESAGVLPAAMGLIRSRNTMTVRVGEFATLPVVRDLAIKSGLSETPMVPAIYLGAFEATLKDLTAAYTMFPNQGVRRQPYIIERIEDREGHTIYKASRAQLACVSPAASYVMTELLQDVLRKGTGASASSEGLTIPAAGKTGTTDDYKDAWFVGYTTQLTCGVWVGFDRPQRIADRGYGSTLALPIWVDFMEEANKFKYEAAAFPRPTDLMTVTLCRSSGQLSTVGCQDVYQAQLPAALIPKQICLTHGGSLGSTLPMGSEPFIPSALPAPPAVPPLAPAADGDADYQVIKKPGGFIFQHRE